MKKIFWIFVLLFSKLAFSAGEPVVNEVRVFFDGQLTTERSFHVGESVSFEVDATDPTSLPLEYVFRLYRHCIYVQDIQSWASNNQANYTFSSEDVGACFGVIVGVKNNDGFDADGFFGDVQSGIRFSVTPAN
ncbi:MAG: hypothetical protein HYV97_16625 [Bdellovibrio sp.]|nr:hypothetical protein [Bdellovibrio sp.]